jgi:hypothetical protein
MADDLREPLAAALAELEQLRAENQRLRGLLGLDARLTADSVEVVEPTLFQSGPLGPAGKVDTSSPQAAKLALFRSLFAGREDVHAIRWENPRTGAVGRSPAVRGGWGQASNGPREYLPLTDEVIARHLTGEVTVGCTRCLPGTPASCWPATSTAAPGRWTRWPAWTPARPAGCPPRWSVPARAMARTCGSSSSGRCRRRPPEHWARACFERR